MMDVAERNRQILENQGLVWMVVRRYREKPGYDGWDLFQEGVFGLMRALELSLIHI